MLEALQRPPALCDDDAEKLRRLTDVRRDLKVCQQLVVRLDGGLLPDCDARGAACVAELVTQSMKALEAELDPNGDWIPEEKLSEDERAELEQLKARWHRVEPVKQQLSDRQYLVSVLTGRRRPSNAVLPRLHELLQHLAQRLQQFVACQADLVRRVRRQEDGSVLAVAQAPQQLALILSYERRITRSIERRLASLRE
jgi:hypothetical protein